MKITSIFKRKEETITTNSSEQLMSSKNTRAINVTTNVKLATSQKKSVLQMLGMVINSTGLVSNCSIDYYNSARFGKQKSA